MMQRPTWKWEWNLNTVVILLGFAAGIAAWGGTWARLTDGQLAHRAELERLDKRMTTVEAYTRILDNHELRISAIEKQASDAATSMRAVQEALSGLAADMRVTREILQRIEAAQARRAPP